MMRRRGKTNAEMRTTQVAIRLTPAEWGVLARLADVERLSVSATARRLIWKAMAAEGVVLAAVAQEQDEQPEPVAETLL